MLSRGLGWRAHETYDQMRFAGLDHRRWKSARCVASEMGSR